MAAERPTVKDGEKEPSVVTLVETLNPTDGGIVSADVSRVLILYTGGTIGMKNTIHGYAPAANFLEGHLRTMLQFHDPTFPVTSGLITPPSIYGKRVNFQIVEYNPLLDSSNMEMTDWANIAVDIEKYYSKFDAFIVLHGTDTMSYTASALSFMLENLGKTVIVTGSQVPLAEARNDAVDNLLGALTIAGHFVIPEVCLFFSNKLMRGNRSKKLSAIDFDAFDTPNFSPLVKVGINIVVAWDLVFRQTDKERFRAQQDMNPNVGTLRLFPGITSTTVRSFLQAPMQGVVLETYGAGNAPDSRKDILNALKEASDRGVVIVNCTQCSKGYVSDIYSTGRILLAHGVVPGSDMTTEAALTKLSYLLAKGYSAEEVRKRVRHNLRGELTVISNKQRFSLQNAEFIQTVARALQAESRDELNLIGKTLYPVLLCSAAGTGDVAAVHSLIDMGGSPNMADYDGRTPLHIAASEGHLQIVDALIGLGASVHPRDRFGHSPLYEAVANGHDEVVDLLCKTGAALNLDETRLGLMLCTAGATDNVAMLKRLHRCGADLNQSDYDGRTALHLAVAAGHKASQDFLLGCPEVDRTRLDRFGNKALPI